MARSWLSFIAAALGLLGLAGYFLLTQQLLKYLSLALIGLMVLLMLVLPFSGRRAAAMRKMLRELESKLLQESAEELKELYLDAYETYRKLPEKEKANFYGRLTKIRERLEESMKAEKELQESLERQEGGPEQSVAGKRYEEVHALYQKLPQSVQQKYYSPLMEMKEKGLKGT